MWKPGNPEENHIEKEDERNDLILMNHHTLPKIIRPQNHCPILLIAFVEVSGRCQVLLYGDENHLAKWPSSPDLKRLQILDLVSSSVFLVTHKSSIGK